MNRKLNITLIVAAFSLLGLIFATMSLPSVATAHGIDGDGDLYSPEDGDCNDEDPTIFPFADDIPDDGIDQDCDGNDGAGSSGIGTVSLVGGIVAVGAVLGTAGWYARRRRTSKGPTRRVRRRRR